MTLLLGFPFVEVSQAAAVFGGIPNYDEALKACPAEFYFQNLWSDAAMHLFRHGMTEGDGKKMILKTDDIEVAKAQFAYFEAWKSSYQASHEVKRAVCGWLLSLMLTAVPDFS